MTLSNARFLPDPKATMLGHLSVTWVDDGDRLLMRQGGDAADAPQASWLIGRDDASKDYVALYTDDRRVSRVYAMSFGKRAWRLWRNAPGFSQRFKSTLSADGNTMHGAWEMSHDGTTWEHDFDLAYSRVRTRSVRRRGRP